MLSITHAATGAFLAGTLQNPVLYVPAALASHYLEDWILHWDVGTGLTNGSRHRMHAFLLELVDLAIAAGLIFLLYRTAPASVQMHAAIGAFVALVPDFIEAPRNFLKWNPPFLRPLNSFHHSLHHSTPDIVRGLIPQLAVLAVILVLA